MDTGKNKRLLGGKKFISAAPVPNVCKGAIEYTHDTFGRTILSKSIPTCQRTTGFPTILAGAHLKFLNDQFFTAAS
ncbi:hypothetical protein D4L85_27785 [Chryseolinea soli]|uniref:Uncharacterized protein n=1 Tax=Chryseolinea soli TaxID=2321403 RepID=A0A385SWR9_9BACT|nr:hypothetical protein D4L85_27785 [Chryseolinea soli]